CKFTSFQIIHPIWEAKQFKVCIKDISLFFTAHYFYFFHEFCCVLFLIHPLIFFFADSLCISEHNLLFFVCIFHSFLQKYTIVSFHQHI
ncbi:hypothetical protein DFJ73DRAFT_814997, partial [Zopfochytrium polystomum]